MKIFSKLRLKFSNLSARTRREIVIALILFLIAVIVNIPPLLENLRAYYAPK